MPDPWQWGWEAAASIATVMAVVLAGVALWYESARARRAQQAEWDRADSIRREDLDLAKRRSQARAARIALAIDQELFSYGGTLVTSEFHLRDAKLATDANGAMLRVLREMEPENLAILKAFVGDLDDFPPDVGGTVTSVLGTLNAFRAARGLVPINSDREAAIEFGQVLRSSASASAQLVRLARDTLAPYVSSKHIVQDFGTVEELQRRETEHLRSREKGAMKKVSGTILDGSNCP